MRRPLKAARLAAVPIAAASDATAAKATTKSVVASRRIDGRLFPVMSRGYGEYCPIAKASEVLGERWTPLILRNIHLRCHTFSEIQRGCPRMSSTLLSQRLRSLARDGVIERVPAPARRGSRYYLTAAGEELIEVILQMGSWGARWLDLAPRDYEPDMVLWGWAKFIDRDRQP